jgi:hypothetical protein
MHLARGLEAENTHMLKKLCLQDILYALRFVLQCYSPIRCFFFVAACCLLPAAC